MFDIQHYDPTFVKTIGENNPGGLPPDIKASLLHIKKKNGFNVYAQSTTGVDATGVVTTGTPTFGNKGFVKNDSTNTPSTQITSGSKVDDKNAWRDSVVIAKRKVIGGDEKTSKKEIYLLFNKISDSNLKVITKQILKLIRDSSDNQDDLLGCLIGRLFQSAIAQVHFCPVYANLCQTILVEMESETVQNLLDSKIASQIKGLQEYRKECDTDNYDNYCDDILWKNRHIGFYQFITELYNHCTLSFQQFLDIVNGIKTMISEENLKFKTEILVESLCRIYRSISESKRITPLEKEQVRGIGKSITSDFKDKMNSRSRFINVLW